MGTHRQGLGHTAHGHIDVQSGQEGHHRRRDGVEHEDPSAVSIFTESGRLAGVGDAQPRRSAADRAPSRHLQTMAVTVGLDHRADRGGAGELAQQGGVVPETVGVHLHPRRPLQRGETGRLGAVGRCDEAIQASTSEPPSQDMRAARIVSAVDAIPVHRSKAISPCLTSISRPLLTRSPRALAAGPEASPAERRRDRTPGRPRARGATSKATSSLVIPTVVALTANAAEAMALKRAGLSVVLGTTDPSGDRSAASRLARSSVRLATCTGPAPASSSAHTTARAAPPAPKTTAGRCSDDAPIPSTAAMNPGASVLKPTNEPSSRRTPLLIAPMAAGSRFHLVDVLHRNLLVRSGDAETEPIRAPSLPEEWADLIGLDGAQLEGGVDAVGGERSVVHHRRVPTLATGCRSGRLVRSFRRRESARGG